MIIGTWMVTSHWIGVTRFALLTKSPSEGYMCVQGRLKKRQVTTRPANIWHEEWPNMSKGSQCKEINKWAEEKQKLDAARQQRGIHSIPNHDSDNEGIVNSATRKLEIRKSSAMPCKFTAPADPKGSSWGRPCASDWSKMETKRLTSSCSNQDHEDISIASQRIRITQSTENIHKDHSADRGHVSLSHHNIVHKPSPIPNAMTILEA